jgi:hypothetical protein
VGELQEQYRGRDPPSALTRDEILRLLERAFNFLEALKTGSGGDTEEMRHRGVAKSTMAAANSTPKRKPRDQASPPPKVMASGTKRAPEDRSPDEGPSYDFDHWQQRVNVLAPSPAEIRATPPPSETDPNDAGSQE